MPGSFLRTRKWPSSKLLFRVFGSCIVVFLAACAQSPAQTMHAARPTPHILVTAPVSLLMPNTLTVGSYTDYPPQEFIDTTTNTVVGFDIDLIRSMAQYMGLHTDIVQLEFSSLLHSLKKNDVDIVISAIPITPDLQKQAELIPYFRGGESLLVENGNPHHIQSTSDLCGLSVGVRSGTLEENDLRIASDMCKQAGNKPIMTIALSKEDDVIRLLTTGRVIATYQDSPVSDYYIRQAPSLFTLGGPVTNENLEGIVVRKGDSSMLKALQSAFQALNKDGTYHYLIMKWGLTTGELTSAATP